MGAPTIDGVAPRRSKLRAYLLLARVSNLPTVWTNVLAAFACATVVAGARFDHQLMYGSLPSAWLSLSMFYMAGMFLNDVFDAPHDARNRADRPIPNGDVSRVEALVIAIAMMVTAETILLRNVFGARSLPWSLGLIAAITFYNFRHKGKWYGPVVMGLCRALIYFVTASHVTGTIATAVVIAAVVMWVYVIALTWIAKAANLGYAVPWMLAGICLVDAVVILAVTGAADVALLAAAGFPLTLALQRVVPGT